LKSDTEDAVGELAFRMFRHILDWSPHPDPNERSEATVRANWNSADNVLQGQLIGLAREVLGWTKCALEEPGVLNIIEQHQGNYLSIVCYNDDAPLSDESLLVRTLSNWNAESFSDDSEPCEIRFDPLAALGTTRRELVEREAPVWRGESREDAVSAVCGVPPAWLADPFRAIGEALPNSTQGIHRRLPLPVPDARGGPAMRFGSIYVRPDEILRWACRSILEEYHATWWIRERPCVVATAKSASIGTLTLFCSTDDVAFRARYRSLIKTIEGFWLSACGALPDWRIGLSL
jgi:hypothetical protein